MILTSDKVGANPEDGTMFNSVTNGKRAAQAADGRLAGSLLPLLDGVRLMVAEAGASLGEAAVMAATNPAQLLGMHGRGRVEVGCEADLLVLDPHMNLKAVFIAGCELE